MLLPNLFLIALFALLPQEEPVQEEQTPAQAQPRNDAQDDGGFRIGVAVDQVFLSVSARSVTGGFVSDLTRDDFRVYEDGQLQTVANFYSQQVPVKVVLLIDASGSTRHNQAEIRRAALELARRLEPEDEVAVITFNYQPRLILNWTNDLSKIQLALESIWAKGNTVLNDALYVTFDDLLRGVEGKTAVILLSDGIDTGSMVRFEECIELALRTEAMVYVVSKLEEYWAEAIYHRQALRGRVAIMPKELSDEYILEMKHSLSRMANLTGGKVLDTKAFASLTDVYAQVAEELKNQYYVSYIPVNKAKDGSWREVHVEVARGGVVTRTRQGYYAARVPSTSP